MFKLTLALISTLTISLLAASQVAAYEPTASYEFPNTETRIINTQSPTKAYKLFIFKPNAPAPANGYPVIYLLDGNSVFGTMIDEVKRRTALKYGDPAIVVAIGYPEDDAWNKRRGRDLTPWAPQENQSKENAQKEQIIPGGADDFLIVIKTQIIPEVEADYNINSRRRTLAGHSYGGLFTLHTFFMKTGLFQNYVAASPSIWYADGRLFKEFEAYAAKHQSAPDTARLLIMFGGCEETPGECDPFQPSLPETSEWLVNTGKMVTNATAMYNKLYKLRGMDVSMRALQGENHTSVTRRSLNSNLSFFRSICE